MFSITFNDLIQWYTMIIILFGRNLKMMDGLQLSIENIWNVFILLNVVHRWRTASQWRKFSIDIIILHSILHNIISKWITRYDRTPSIENSLTTPPHSKTFHPRFRNPFDRFKNFYPITQGLTIIRLDLKNHHHHHHHHFLFTPHNPHQFPIHQKD